MAYPSSRHIIQYLAPLLCSLCVIAALVCQVVYYGQYGADPMGIFTRQTKQMLNWSGAVGTGMEFIDSGFVRRLTSVTWSVTEQQLQEQIDYLVVDRQKNLDSLSLIPGQSLLMLDWADMAAATSGFFESRLGQQVNSINWPRVMKKLEVPEQLRKQLEERIGGLHGFVKSRLFRELFSGRMVVALLLADMDRVRKEQGEPQYKPSLIIVENLLVILNLRQEYLLRGGLSLLSLGSQKKKFLYNGVNVFEFGWENGRKIYMYSAGRQLVASLALEPIQRSVDLYLHTFLYKDSGFHQNQAYEKLKQRSQVQDDFFLYADIAGIKSQINAFYVESAIGLEEQEKQHEKRKKIRTKNDFPGLQRLAFFHHSKENIQQFTSIVQFDQGQPESLLKTIFSRKAVLNHGLTKMPSNLLIYFWTNWIDLPGLWRGNYLREDEGGAADQIAAWIEKQTGMSINYFLGLFGHEFGFNVDEISSSGLVPVPRICMCIEMKDRDRVEQLIEKMIVGLPVKRTDVAGQSVVSFMIANGLMQPSYAILRRFIVMADGPDQIENLLKGNPELLVDDPPFMEVDTGMRQPSNLVMFIRTEKLNEELKEIAIWAATIIGIGDKKAAAKSKELVDQVILPLLDGLKMYRAKGVRGSSAPGEVVFDIALSAMTGDNDLESMPISQEAR